MEINFLELWARMGFPVRAVVVVLTLQALACVTVIIDRLVVLLQTAARARHFVQQIAPALESQQYESGLKLADEMQDSHLATYLTLGLRTFTTRMTAGDSVTRAAELARRALDRRGDAISRELNRGMNVLASTGSTAPFVGLLGTVLGIINAFKLIAAEGSGGIGTIGSAIGEALVVTGYGLVVAIPSVLIFNYLTSRIAGYESGLINAGSELLDQLEIAAQSEPEPVSSAGQPERLPSTATAASALG